MRLFVGIGEGRTAQAREQVGIGWRRRIGDDKAGGEGIQLGTSLVEAIQAQCRAAIPR